MGEVAEDRIKDEQIQGPEKPDRLKDIQSRLNDLMVEVGVLREQISGGTQRTHPYPFEKAIAHDRRAHDRRGPSDRSSGRPSTKD